MASKKPKKKPIGNAEKPETRTPAEVVEAARLVLRDAERGLRDVEGGSPEDLAPGLHNVVVFGRSVTLALQRLKNIAPGFSTWYDSAVPTSDPLLRYMNDARNAILKEAAVPHAQVSFRLDHLVVGGPHSTVSSIFKTPPPPGASELFIGEARTGGSGWVVVQPDGTREKYYAEFSPSFNGEVTTHLPDPPGEFLGEKITDTTVASLCGLYVGWLQHMVEEAERRFT